MAVFSSAVHSLLQCVFGSDSELRVDEASNFTNQVLKHLICVKKLDIS